MSWFEPTVVEAIQAGAVRIGAQQVARDMRYDRGDREPHHSLAVLQRTLGPVMSRDLVGHRRGDRQAPRDALADVGGGVGPPAAPPPGDGEPESPDGGQ